MAKKVLVCPLDWGLGHATRCVPIIKELEKSCEVLIAGSGASLTLLKQEIPGAKFFELPSYGITYSNSVPLLLHLALQSPRIAFVIKREHRIIEQIVEKEKIDFIISDNRYGCYHKIIPSAIISHQLTLIAPAIATYYNQKLIKRFHQCWIPDTPTHLLSGKLSVNKNIAAKFIGPLSRLKKTGAISSFDILALISGPEPQRTLFEDALLKLLPLTGLSYKIVRGLPGTTSTDPNIIPHLPSARLASLIEAAGVVICRSGYSTIMDLAALKKKAIFVPTPGQTEQLYLAKEMERKKIAPMISQKDLVLLLDKLKDYTGFCDDYFDNNLLQTTLREFLG